jgi:hypothetical protein
VVQQDQQAQQELLAQQDLKVFAEKLVQQDQQDQPEQPQQFQVQQDQLVRKV